MNVAWDRTSIDDQKEYVLSLDQKRKTNNVAEMLTYSRIVKSWKRVRKRYLLKILYMEVMASRLPEQV